MSTDDDREEGLDERLRALTRRVAEAAPSPVPFEVLSERARRRRRWRAPLVAAGALATALALVVAVVTTRHRDQPTVSSPVGEPIALEAQGTTSLRVGSATLPANRFRLPDGRELAVLATPEQLCARIGTDAVPTCSPPPGSNVGYVLLAEGDALVLVTITPAGSALAVITVAGTPYTQQPVAGVVAFALPTRATPFTVVTYDAAGRQTGTVSWP
jgi:hypothetical protein